MKKRMRTVWTVTWSDGTQWRGDCPHWAAQPLPEGATLTSERVMWLGPAWHCTACAHGLHH